MIAINLHNYEILILYSYNSNLKVKYLLYMKNTNTTVGQEIFFCEITLIFPGYSFNKIFLRKIKLFAKFAESRVPVSWCYDGGEVERNIIESLIRRDLIQIQWQRLL